MVFDYGFKIKKIVIIIKNDSSLMEGRRFIFIIGCLITYLNLSAQPLTQTIKGTVSDTDTQTPLIGATVFIPHLSLPP